MNRKILGCILGAAIGDAMGSATENQSYRQIQERFRKRVTTFMTPPEVTLARGREKGQFTDAFSIPWFLMEEIIEQNGKFDRETARVSLKKWGNSEYFAPFAGMTTRNVVNRLNQDESMGTWAYSGRLGNKLYKSHYYALSSNGAGVKAFPAGILNPGNPEGAVNDVCELTMASHDDPLSISGASAVAAAVAEAFGDTASVYSIVHAAVYGSIQGEGLARAMEDVWVYPGPSVTKRIEMAVGLALHGGSTDVITELRDRIGCGPAIAETVPTALGIFIKNQGNLMECIYDGVNIGDETSAIASVVGGIAGAFQGYEAVPKGFQKLLEEMNHIDFATLAEGMEKLWKRNILSE